MCGWAYYAYNVYNKKVFHQTHNRWWRRLHLHSLQMFLSACVELRRGLCALFTFSLCNLKCPPVCYVFGYETQASSQEFGTVIPWYLVYSPLFCLKQWCGTERSSARALLSGSGMVLLFFECSSTSRQLELRYRGVPAIFTESHSTALCVTNTTIQSVANWRLSLIFLDFCAAVNRVFYYG